MSARTFPRIAIGVIIICSALELSSQFLKARRIKKVQAARTDTVMEASEDPGVEAIDAAADPAAAPDDGAKKAEKKDYRGPLGIVVAMILYFILFKPLGFILTGILVCTGLCLYFKAKTMWAVITGVAIPILVYMLFAVALGTPLPKGVLFFL